MYHFGLVGDTVKTDVRRQERGGLRQLLIHLVTERNDIVSGHHLHIENQTRSTVKLYILFGCLVAPLDIGYIFEPYGTSGHRIGPYNLLLQLIFGHVRYDHLQGTVGILVTAYGSQSLQGHLGL